MLCLFEVVVGVTGSSSNTKRFSRRTSRHFAVHKAVRLAPALVGQAPITLEEYLTPDPSLREPLPCADFLPDPLDSLSSRTISLHSAFSVHGFDFVDGRKVWYEAELELCFILLAKLRPDVASVAEQPNAIYYLDEDNVTRRHTFDFLVTLTDGRKCLVAVKPSELVQTTRIDRTVSTIAAQISPSVADMVLLFTEESISPVDLYNAKAAHFARKSTFPDDDVKIDDVTRHLVEPTSVRSIIGMSGLGGYGFDAVVRALTAGSLRLINYEQITFDTLVCSAAKRLEAAH